MIFTNSPAVGTEKKLDIKKIPFNFEHYFEVEVLFWIWNLPRSVAEFQTPLPLLAGDDLEIRSLHTCDISRLRVSKRQDGIWWRKRDFSHSETHFNFQNTKINKCFFKFIREIMRIFPKYYRHTKVKQQDAWVCHFLKLFAKWISSDFGIVMLTLAWKWLILWQGW